MASSHASRRDALRALLPSVGVDALLVTDLVNIRYLTGFTGSNAALTVHVDGDDASEFCTDGRYRDQAAAQVPDLPTVLDRASALALVAMAGERSIGLLGFESGHVSVDAHEELVAAASGVRLTRAPGIVEQLRAVKDDGEIAVLRTACEIADAALAALVSDGGIRAGRTERDVALDLEARMRGAGADDVGFATIVAAGAHSAVPHHCPTATPLCAGDLVKIDFGALLGGYHSDMTRTFVLGPAAAWQKETHALVAGANSAGLAAAVPGADVAAVDAAARDVVAAAGRAEEFLHGLGHGVGLQIHEAPWLGPRSRGPLVAGMVVTVEPGVYVTGVGGVRIEDVIVVGTGEVLTAAPRDLLEL